MITDIYIYAQVVTTEIPQVGTMKTAYGYTQFRKISLLITF